MARENENGTVIVKLDQLLVRSGSPVLLDPYGGGRLASSEDPKTTDRQPRMVCMDTLERSPTRWGMPLRGSRR